MDRRNGSKRPIHVLKGSPRLTFGPQERIIQILKEHPDYSARKLAEIIGVTPKAIEKHLARLKADGIIQRDGPDKGGNWRVL